jgi:hypothetical protein
MKKNIIKFIANSESVYDVEDPPVPAKQTIPKWFKEIPASVSYINAPPYRKSSTVKRCMPFLDALTSGYTIRMPQDVAVYYENGKMLTHWGVDTEFADPVMDLDFPKFRSEGLPVPEGYYPDVWRLTTYPRIVTPKGYSILVTHPLNRYDLPFLTLSGVVDSDSINVVLALNMYVRNGFEGIIERGTPVAQVIPFKREEWGHEVLPSLNKLEERKEHFNVRSKLDRSYMNNFWNKKKFD